MSKNNKLIIMSNESVKQAILNANDRLSKYSNTAGEQVKFFKSTVSNTIYLADIEWAKTKDYRHVFIGIQSDGMTFLVNIPLLTTEY